MLHLFPLCKSRRFPASSQIDFLHLLMCFEGLNGAAAARHTLSVISCPPADWGPLQRLLNGPEIARNEMGKRRFPCICLEVIKLLSFWDGDSGKHFIAQNIFCRNSVFFLLLFFFASLFWFSWYIRGLCFVKQHRNCTKSEFLLQTCLRFWKHSITPQKKNPITSPMCRFYSDCCSLEAWFPSLYHRVFVTREESVFHFTPIRKGQPISRPDWWNLR